MSGTNIVTLNVSEVVASLPSTFQSTGAIVSLGGTKLATGTNRVLTQPSDLTQILASTGFTELVNQVNAFFAQGSNLSVYVLELGTNATPAALDTWIQNNPGVFYAYLTPVEWDTIVALNPPTAPTLSMVAGGTIAATTYWVKITYVTAAGETLPSTESTLAVTANNLLRVPAPTALAGTIGWNVYVFTATGGEQLQNLAQGPLPFTAPWTEPATGLVLGAPVPTVNTSGNLFTAILSKYTSPTAMTYFFGETTINTFSQYQNLGLKCLNVTVPSPAGATTEWCPAGQFYKLLNYNPSPTNRMTPMANSFVFGATPWPTSGNGPTFVTLKNAFVNFVYTGIEGGISDALIKWGTMMDGNDASFWYDVDYVVINVHRIGAAAVINGANNPQNPLYYNQPGINTLETDVQNFMNNTVAFGVSLPGSITVNAQSFASYIAAFPNNYQAGIYTGIGVTFTPQNGFKSITFNVTVSEIPTGG